MLTMQARGWRFGWDSGTNLFNGLLERVELLQAQRHQVDLLIRHTVTPHTLGGDKLRSEGCGGVGLLRKIAWPKIQRK